MQRCLPADTSSSFYRTTRTSMNIGLEAAALAAGGMGLVKAALALSRAAFSSTKIAQMSTRLFSKDLNTLEKFSSSATNTGKQLNRFHGAASELSEVGQNNIRILRGWAKSKGWIKQPNFQGGPEKWGTYQNSGFQWNLKIKPESSFRSRLEPGSNVPRFDSRIKTGNKNYINPFTGEMGGEEIGTHLPLNFSYD